MIYINEFFPNPAGTDSGKEFLEFYNSGVAGVSLAGYALSTGKKKISIKGTVPGKGYLVLSSRQAKFTLKNTDGGLWLYGPDGRIVDSARFLGTAPEGKSFSRIDFGKANTQHFAFAAPTPGTANRAPDVAVAIARYPVRTPLDPSPGPLYFLGLMAGVAFGTAFIIFYVIRKSEAVSQFFFGSDEGVRGEARLGDLA